MSDADPQDLVDADRSDLRRQLDQLAAAARVAETQADNHTAAVRDAVVGRMGYNADTATAAEREQLRVSDDVMLAVELYEAIRSAQHYIDTARWTLAELDGEGED